MRIPDLIDRQRRGQPLSADDLAQLIGGYVRGEVPDYQVAAWLMAVCCRGMSRQEVFDLTTVMVDSGRRLDLSDLGVVADKHSTGGVGDKTSLVVVPLIAACGVPVAKMSGRGLGFTGGTLDKLESIPGLSVDLDTAAFRRQVERIGLAIVGQSADLAPADGKLYALRDVTATVESIPLVASSIMSKKLAAGAHVVVLDVKVGSGAFVALPSEARELAETMVAIGEAAGRRVSAYVSDMSQPLGRAVGNALEIAEAVEALQGGGPADLVDLAVSLAGQALWLAGAAPDRRAGEAAAEEARRSGRAYERFLALVEAQGGDARAVEKPGRLPIAPIRGTLTSDAGGLVGRLDARQVAHAALALGAGRERKDQPIDRAVGLVLRAKVGQRVHRGDALADIHAGSEAGYEAAAHQLRRAYLIADQPVPIHPLVYWRSTD